MELKTYDKLFRSLQVEAEKLGYRNDYTTNRNEIDTTKKVIRMKYYVHTLENLYCFCHELGHARERNPNLELYKNNRIYRFYSEIMAWVLGYKFVSKYGLPKLKYFQSAIPHLKTYVRNKPRKPVIR